MTSYPEIISLDGDWQFAYTRSEPKVSNQDPPASEAFEAMIPVPGYWDDYTERLQYTDFWSRVSRFNPEYRRISFPMGAGKPADASLPFLLGTGWYKKSFVAGADWTNGTVTLCVGGVTLEAWVWLNGHFIGHHVGHLTPFEMNLEEYIKPGKSNQLIIAVANTRTDRIGCSIRGFTGKSAGIYRSVELKVAGHKRIKDCYIHADRNLKQLMWEITIEGKQSERAQTLDWEIQDPNSEHILASGSQSVDLGVVKWTSSTFGMKTWSDHHPNLYRIRLCLRDGQTVSDCSEQMFGLRTIEAKGISLQLNGIPVILRGLTDHAYFPETCTPPSDLEYYRMTLKKLRQLGFNWVRFHTWTPPVECLQAADELGMMLQVESPNGFAESDWLDILYTCRRHPSVIIYCCGNEVPLNEEMIAYVKQMALHMQALAPDALFNPMEGLHSVEYLVNEEDEGYVSEPYPHNAKRMAELRSYSDVFAPHGVLFSYHSLDTDDFKMEQRLQMYKRPCLIHEAGINDSYLNLDLEHRYKGTRIGTEMYAAARTYVEKMGLIQNAPLYYQNSCKWMLQIVKYSIENIRRSQYVSGYDFLGAIDCHWHRTGYAVGLLNEFYELKAGVSVESVRQYNGESVLLADCGKHRNLTSGQQLNLSIWASLFGQTPLEHGKMWWTLLDEERTVYVRGEQTIPNIALGKVEALGEIQLTIPDLPLPRKMLLEVYLNGGEYQVKNSWDYWVFPTIEQLPAEKQPATRVLSSLDAESISYIANGGKALLLGEKPFPTLPTTFQIMSGGRVQGNNATVVREHPLMMEFPHEGFCDWQFYSMLEGAETVVFNDLEIPFDPIVEVVSSYKMIRKQSSLFELRVGEGRLLVCTLRFDEADCAARYLYYKMLNYMESNAFNPTSTIPPEKLRILLEESRSLDVDFTTDEGYDNGGHVLAVTELKG
ncbi:glycoside hydrolase family 2 protein [Paenibacillus donghaensis]|uniref:Uncharacterized protein n=1 Tax=Paenibacillus donghaensis TaxID=414771 RepID=A0A2Z2KRI7_9BACL|nr:sugar-binding domain-containing protein [Paenibacillus donghaensis]ASA21598.1 hypothetical protein B9T62_12960 [Paenibacillus donghaensis]